jgi:hypothetical protein
MKQKEWIEYIVFGGSGSESQDDIWKACPMNILSENRIVRNHHFYVIAELDTWLMESKK